MPYFKYTAKSPDNQLGEYWISYYWEVPAGVTVTTKCMDNDNGKKGHTTTFSSSSSYYYYYKTKYEMLSHSLKSCLDYCALLCRCGYDYKPEKETTLRLMVAEGLIEENGSCLEEVASSLMDELADRGMLIQYFSSFEFATRIEISEEYYKLCVVERDEEVFLARNPLTPIRLSVCYHYGNIFPLLENLPIQSLFFRTDRISDQAIIDTIAGLSSLFVLRFEMWVDDHILLSKIGEFINLKFFSLSLWVDSSPYVLNLDNFQQLQTLELYSYSKTDSKVVEEAPTIETLRHFSCSGGLLKGIGRQINLQSLVSSEARSEFMEELSSLNQLLHLDVYHVGDENINKLFERIESMKKLIYLSIRTHLYPNGDVMLPLLEPFSPPPHLQQLLLVGNLMELPNWIVSTENLTTLVLNGSSLTEDSSTFFQFLPNLKFLCLFNAYKAKFMGKEFCKEGGFPKLETLEIRSDFLVSWSEIVERAFPSLTSLLLECRELRFFPEGAQRISKLERLELKAHGDLIRRLNGDENYKIKHIFSFSMSSH